MRIERLNNDANYVGLALQLQAREIDLLIEQLRQLRSNPEQHFHLSTTGTQEGCYVDIEISAQGEADAGNGGISGLAIEPDEGG